MSERIPVQVEHNTGDQTASDTYGEDAWVSQEELLRLDAEGKAHGQWVEVVKGIVVYVERDMTYLHLLIIETLYDLLKPFVKAHGLGRVHSDGLAYILVGSRKKAVVRRYPDISFIRAGRIPADYDYNGDFEGAPNLAVEVVSPGQTNAYFTQLVGDYLSAGSEEVWVIYPARKELIQYRRDADAPRIYQANETVDVSGLFPGFELRVEMIFETNDA